MHWRNKERAFYARSSKKLILKVDFAADRIRESESMLMKLRLLARNTLCCS